MSRLLSLTTKYPGLIALLIAFVLSAVALRYLFPAGEQDFAEFGLGEGTASYFASDDGYPIHIDSLHPEVVDSVLEGWKLRNKKDVLFLFGNSQMHGINQFREGEKSYNHILFDSLHAEIDVLAQSIPNANLQEFLYMFRFWNSRLKVRKVIAPVFFDDMREDGIRFAYAADNNRSVLIDEPSVAAEEWNATVRNHESEANTNPDNAALANTVQERVEQHLDQSLSQISSTWSRRPLLRGYLFTELYYLRNWVFGINPQSVRKVLPVQYSRNLNALELLAAATRESDVELVLYVPPIRSDISAPYDQNEYLKFKQDVEDVAAKYPHITLANFEGIVDGQFWGMKQSTTLGDDKLEYDFMHFNYQGHKILANALYSMLKRPTNDF